jgi:hypothetical protein
MPRKNEEELRLRADTLVLRDGDDQSRVAGLAVALTRDAETGSPPEAVDALVDTLIVLAVSAFVMRQGCVAVDDCTLLAVLTLSRGVADIRGPAGRRTLRVRPQTRRGAIGERHPAGPLPGGSTGKEVPDCG